MVDVLAAAPREPEVTAPALRPVVVTSEKARIPTAFGEFEAVAFSIGNEDHVALFVGDLSAPAEVLARIHSSCLTGDVFHSLRCDCGAQLEEALRRIATEGRGVLVYLNQEGRGIGLANKIRAYALQDAGADTVEANEKLGFPPDARDYAAAAWILQDLGVRRVRLLTNNPAKVAALERGGVLVVERIPLVVGGHEENRRYLDAKRRRLGHVF